MKTLKLGDPAFLANAATSAFTPISASGGTETTVGNYKIHTFTSSSSFVVSDAGSDGLIEYLVVAGGGGGGQGSNAGGGGGAGGMLTGSDTVTATTYTITIGGGGAGGGPLVRVRD